MEDEPIAPQNRPQLYQIRITGHLDDDWAEWFDGATVMREAGGSTLLTCRVIDQAALYGLLRQMRDLGVCLISVNHIASNPIGPSATTDDRSTSST